VKGVLIPLAIGAALLLTQSLAPDLVHFMPRKVLAWTIFACVLWGTIGVGRTGAAWWVGLLAAIAVIVNPIAPLEWPAGWELWAERAAGALASCCVIRLWQ